MAHETAWEVGFVKIHDVGGIYLAFFLESQYVAVICY